MTSIKLSDIAESHVNNLNLMRFIAAVFVIISHCYVVTLGGDAPGDFISNHTSGQLTFGGMAVGLFFVFGVLHKSTDLYVFAQWRSYSGT